MPDEPRHIGEGTPEERLEALEQAYRGLQQRFTEFEATTYRFGKRMVLAVAIAVLACCGALFANFRLVERINDDARANDTATCERGNEFRDLTRDSLSGVLDALDPTAAQRSEAKKELDKITATKRDCDVEPKNVPTTPTSTAAP